MRRFALAILGVVLSGCGGGHGSQDEREPRDAPFHPPLEMLTRYDANHDGILTRAELEAGLKADFDAADTNHDGRLDKDETRAENEKRWKEGLSTTSTLVDWNQDGYVDFDEFAGTARSYFEQLDRKGEGQIDLRKLQPAKPADKPGEAPDARPPG
jgi:Ca2+-binding EF-hand superfamily protein